MRLFLLATALLVCFPTFADEGGDSAAPLPDKPLNLNVLPPQPQPKKPKSHSVRSLTPVTVACEYQGTTWATKDRTDEDRCRMRGGKLKVVSGKGEQLPDMQSIPGSHHPTRVHAPTNLDPGVQNPHLNTDPSGTAPADGSDGK